MELDRVEILRGPQGTLYGRDTTGGAIRLYTKLPADEFGVRASATFGTYDRRDLILHADLPISDTLKSEVSFLTTERDGYVRSLTVNRAFGDIDDTQVRGDLLWTPSERFSARFTVEDQKFEGTQANVTLNMFDPGAPGVDAGFVDPQGRTIFWVPNSQYNLLAGVDYRAETQVMGFPGGEVGDLQTKSDFIDGPGLIIDLQNFNLKLDFDITYSIIIT
jgi:outer membrane receptor protein involved in Fe transport